MEERRGVLAIFDNGSQIYYNKTEIKNHDDILWQLLSNNGVLPDSYKRLTSLDDNFKHEKSSAGKEAMIAASNGILIVFFVYDEKSEYSYAVIYFPETINKEQKESLTNFLDNYNLQERLNVYFCGLINSEKTYSEINDINYIPNFSDEETFSEYKDLVIYFNNLNVSKNK